MSQLVSGQSLGGKTYKSAKWTLGGLNNGDGILEILDENGELSVLLNNLGMTLGDGRKIIGGDGLLSNITVYSNVNSRSFLGGTLLLPVGYDYNQKSSLDFNFTVPNSFKIVSAYIVLSHVPVKFIDPVPANIRIGNSRNLKLYKTEPSENSLIERQLLNYVFDNNTLGIFEEITEAFGPTGFTGKNIGYSETTSIDIKDYIKNGYNILKIQTSNNVPTDEFGKLEQTGACNAVLNIIGYTKF